MKQIILTSEQVEAFVTNIANQIDSESHNTIAIVCITQGGKFLTDKILSSIKTPHLYYEIDVKSYNKQTQGQLVLSNDNQLSTFVLEDKVYIVDDIVDSGNTMSLVVEKIKSRFIQSKPIQVISLIKRSTCKARSVEILSSYQALIYQGSEFLYGCGMDDCGMNRDCPYVYIKN